MSDLKPCPFCGWGTIVDGGFLNHKCTCNSCGASTKGYPTWELAIEAWNRRLTDPSAEPEIIHCKDCIYYHPSYCEIWSKFGTVQTPKSGFCYKAERRRNENQKK